MLRTDKPAIMIVDDQVELLNSLKRLLQRDFDVEVANSGQAALDKLKEKTFSVIVSDQRMPEMDGVTFLSKAKEMQPDAIRILLTAYADIEATIAAVNQAQIYQYIGKPFEPDEFRQVLRNAAHHYALVQENKRLQEELKLANQQLTTENIVLKQQMEQHLDLGEFIGSSPPILRILKLVKKVKDTPTTVLLLGETGTGKEMLAKIIHYNSNRSKHLFVAQNCAAIPDTLLQSELFGHVKGAFTGAIKDKKGLFELADKGTIFLDEIGDTSPALQLGLLRVLQEGEIRPLGAHFSKKVDVRVIAATNKDLKAEVKKGNFREDLFYRLSVFPIELPPLRKRREDIPDLVHHFIKKYARRIGKNILGISPKAMNRLMQSDFPGNIRELENEIERMVTLADNETVLDESLLSAHFFNDEFSLLKTMSSSGSLKETIGKIEREMIRRALKENHGNILRSAQQLGISRVGLHKMLKRHQIDPLEYK
ncbi:sigma-54-dependent Fis family transcriptional regulator [candidate division KSB1 bacterium]|nr:MAG: sigma-54-dependent Fis family transcriptional regulator [candidate division KSB1 bacterium]